MAEMTKERKLLILALMLVCLTTVVAWFINPAFNMYLLYSRLDSEGVKTEAAIVKRETRIDQSLLGVFSSHAGNHRFSVEFKDLSENVHHSAFNVSKLLFERYEVGDVIQVVCLREDPTKCTAAAHVGNTKLISKYSVICGVIVWLFFVLVPGVIGVFLITRTGGSMNITLEVKEMKCPECFMPMQEGYIPLISGINWRRRGESVGMLTLFSGLPGTVWWNPFNRPKLPGFHCPDCKVVLFKYGK